MKQICESYLCDDVAFYRAQYPYPGSYKLILYLCKKCGSKAMERQNRVLESTDPNLRNMLAVVYAPIDPKLTILL